MRILYIIFLIVIIGCQDDRADDSVEFHLVIGNQSEEINPVDIQVFLSDRTLLKQEFNTLDFHNWENFDFKAPRGNYTLRISSEKTQSTESIQLALDKEKWILIEYYFPPATSNPGNNFFIRISNESLPLE